MSKHILRSDRALRDLDNLAAYIQSGRPEAAIRFLSAAEESFKLLATSPGLGQRQRFRRPELADLRVWQVRDFENFLIFYRPLERGIEVVRVLHAARDIEAIFSDRDE